MSEGKYDDECDEIHNKTEARLSCVLVIEGNAGTGFSVNTSSKAMLDQLPEILESIAEGIRHGSQQIEISSKTH